MGVTPYRTAWVAWSLEVRPRPQPALLGTPSAACRCAPLACPPQPQPASSPTAPAAPCRPLQPLQVFALLVCLAALLVAKPFSQWRAAIVGLLAVPTAVLIPIADL